MGKNGSMEKLREKVFLSLKGLNGSYKHLLAPKLIGKKVRRENILAEVRLPENGFKKIEEEESKFYKFQGQGTSLETFGFDDVSVFLFNYKTLQLIGVAIFFNRQFVQMKK